MNSMKSFLDKLGEQEGAGLPPESHVDVVQSAAPSEPVTPLDLLEVEAGEAIAFDMPSKQYMKGGHHHTLVFQGVCSHCAHCGMPLTDSVSIERGLGPICSKKGYMEDPTNPDEMQAMIDLAEYPELVTYLTTKYKPQGVRGLMNGLVKICSLNRRSPVHQACTDAVESLGFKQLASLLRESISVLEIKEHDPNTFHVWVKKSEWGWKWSYALRAIKGAYLSKQYKGWLVPKAEKPALWAAMIQHYEGFYAKVPTDDGVGKKSIKIKKPAPKQTTLPLTQ